MDAVVDPVSLFDPVYSDGGDTVCVMDQVRDTRNTDESWLDRIALREAVDKLSPREQRILAMRFYDGKTQMEVSGENRYFAGAGLAAGEKRHQHHPQESLTTP